MLKTAIFTIVQDDPVFLQIWLRHYLPHFLPNDIYVLNHESLVGQSTLESLRGQVNVLPVTNGATFDLDWLLQTVMTFQRFLLQSYDVVMFAEADELIMTTPARGGLASYLQELRTPYAVCSGYEVVHDFTEEPAIDFTRTPLLRQRKWWYPSKAYSKPLIARQPLDWCKGFHSARQTDEYRVVPDPDLLLVHLHKLDYAYKKSQILGRQQRLFTKDLAHVAGVAQQRYTRDEELQHWWRRHIDGFPEFTYAQNLVPIPAWLQDAI